MSATTRAREKSTEQTEGTDCENDYCDGPEGETFPCFACFDPEREYDWEISE